MNKFRNWLYRVMYGRYGSDELSRFTLITALILTFVSIFFRSNQYVYLTIYTLSMVLLIWTIYRTFSRDIAKRSQENYKFVSKKNYIKQRWQDRKTYKYFNCPKCKTHLRVPKGVGVVTITCKKCGTQFDRKA